MEIEEGDSETDKRECENGQKKIKEPQWPCRIKNTDFLFFHFF